jgi:hypothetical protein
MTVLVRPVNLKSERDKLIEILERNLTDLAHSIRFNWLYQDNPSGPAWSWFAIDKETQEIVGVASVFPRSMWVAGEVRLCGQVGDFAVDTSYRSLGPALMLQRATFGPVDQGVVAFCYDCPPHDQGMSTFRRLGIDAISEMQRYTRLLRIDRQITKRIGQGRLAVPIARLGNVLLDLWTYRRYKICSLELSPYGDRFGEEFSALDERVGGSDVVRARRKAEDLNWRYREDPLHQYRVQTARRNGELVAFAIYSISGQDAYLIDLFGRVSVEVGLELLAAVIDDLKKEPVQSLHWLINSGNCLSDLVRKTHFRYRSPAARIVAYACPDSKTRTLLDRNPKWFFNHVDILA